MIQILALREFVGRDGKLRKSEVWYDKELRANSIQEIFTMPAKLIDRVAPDEQYNLYYTIAHCLDEPGRKLESQDCLPFDVDGLLIPETDTEDYLIAVSKVVVNAIGVDYDKVGVLFSGNGLQFIVGIQEPILDVQYFNEARPHYKAICDRINLALAKAELPGRADPSVWSPARLMRMPTTWNIKKDKPKRLAKVLQSNVEHLPVTLEKLSRLPQVEATDQIVDEVLKSFPTPDTKTILEECKFMSWCQTHPEKVSEPEWYAMLSISTRFHEGRKISHKLSEGHPGYSFHEAEQKIDQALESSGPRTCRNINVISGGKCAGCKHFGSKLISPIVIEGPNSIKSEKNGFWNVFVDENGNVKLKNPDYYGLVKKFHQVYGYKCVKDVRSLWKFTGTHYEEICRDDALIFCEEMMNPKPNRQQRNEFLEKLFMYNAVKKDWFEETTAGKMNFQNGVLDIESGVLTDHTPEMGFRSVLSCEYDAKAVAPRFLQFMQEVLLERDDLIKIVQEYLGYAFSNQLCKYQKMLVLLGDGENGKSTLVKIIRKLAGMHLGASELSFKALQDPQNRVMLEGKFLNISEENSRDGFRDTELVKNIVTGGFVTAKRLYSQPYTFENRAKLIMLCNRAPDSSDNTHGFFRRFIFIPFDQRFSRALGNVDTQIDEKLEKELPGIFNWIMDGYKRLEKQGGFTSAKASDDILEAYKADVDPMHAFFEEFLEVTKDLSLEINRDEVYQEFVHYCQVSGIKYVPPMRRFLEFLRKKVKTSTGRYPQEHRRRVDNMRVNYVTNLRKTTVTVL